MNEMAEMHHLDFNTPIRFIGELSLKGNQVFHVNWFILVENVFLKNIQFLIFIRKVFSVRYDLYKLHNLRVVYNST